MADEYVTSFLKDNPDFTLKRLKYFEEYIYYLRMLNCMYLGLESYLSPESDKYVFPQLGILR